MSDAADFFVVINHPSRSPECMVNAHADIDLHNAARFQDALLDALVVGPAQLIVDLAEVGHIGPAGVEVLVSARQRASDHGTTLLVKGASPTIVPILEANGLLTGGERTPAVRG